MVLDTRTMAGRCWKMFTLRMLMLALAMVFSFNMGTLYSTCKIEFNAIKSVEEEKYSNFIGKSHVHKQQKRQFDSEEIKFPQYHRVVSWRNTSQPKSRISKPLSVKKPFPVSEEDAGSVPKVRKHPLYEAKDLYGTGTEAHHRALKKLGFESTSKHSFKSPYIKDLHIYSPETIRKAPGERKVKTISCANCPERFYITNRHNNDFKSCPYSECRLTKTSGHNPDADVMIFWQDPEMEPPPKPKHQVWVYMSWETPPHRDHPRPRELWLDKFNWTISYRLDADFSLPYDTMTWRDSTLLKSDDFYLQMAKRKTKTAAWWVSHCISRSHREQYVHELQKYIDVDIYGACSNRSCDRKYTAGCYSSLNETYKFYLSFENSLCIDYVTEKFFKVFRYRYNIIPVVLSSFDFEKYLPANILVNAEKFDSAKSLASYLKELGNDPERYAKMLKEKDRLALQGRRMDWCDFCEKLHTGKFKHRVIHDVKDFTNEGGKCWDKVIKEGWPCT